MTFAASEVAASPPRALGKTAAPSGPGLRVPPPVTRVLLGASLPLGLLVLWTLSSRFGWLPDQILPAPSVVADAFAAIVADGTLREHAWRSFVRVVVGFGIGAAAGVAVGAAIGLLPGVRSLVWPVLTAFTQVNTLAWMPLLVLLVGIDEPLKYVGVAWATAIPVVLATWRGLAGTPAGLVELGHALNLTPAERFTTIVLPQSLPALFTGLREGVAAAWQAVVIVELFASFEGLGYLVVWGRQLFQLELVIVGMLVIAAVGLLISGLLRATERLVQPWQTEASHGD